MRCNPENGGMGLGDRPEPIQTVPPQTYRWKKRLARQSRNYHECESLWLFIELNKCLIAGPCISWLGGTVRHIANSTVDSVRGKILRGSSEKTDTDYLAKSASTIRRHI